MLKFPACPWHGAKQVGCQRGRGPTAAAPAGRVPTLGEIRGGVGCTKQPGLSGGFLVNESRTRGTWDAALFFRGRFSAMGRNLAIGDDPRSPCVTADEGAR